MPPSPQGDERTSRPPLLEIVIPAYNEEGRLPGGLLQLCAKLARMPFPSSVIVVDNDSTDRTAEIVETWPRGPVPVRLIRCATPGKGAAVRAGLLGTSAPFVGFLDADMATDLGAIDVALGLLLSGERVVIGSRGHDGSLVENRHSKVRELGAFGFRGLAGLLVHGVSDTQCGFKFFDGVLARDIAAQLRTPGFAFDVELLARCLRQGSEVTEIPVRWRDMPGSRFSPARHTFGIVLELGRIWLRLRARPRPAARPAWEPPLDPVGYP
ncbi:glycosyltransferase involved in cell wall biosynthesis [Nonomuraea fuscirosea]|uniref:Glycosyltransferase involved in cell wall biosynthesis n=1 Tax=Nonomuraea fuscirosea TaxID=1291556 RepID=A0A2T0N7G5_9ACTN|nr:glycosyltransferase [Nonomuraea fuscirosea]PRX68497.1 glycosyltransferase involved in cell wall biosynthesis [Nonomuraea fuscirosea]